MTWGMVGAAAITTVGGIMSANKASKGASQASAQQQAAIDKATKLEQPVVDATMPALNTLSQGFAPGGEFTKKFTMADATNSPAEQHALQQGTQAIQNSAASKGGLLGTNTLQGLEEFGQSNAAQFQNQAFNQWLAERQQQIGGLSGLAGAATGAVENQANLQLGKGAAQASGTVGQANAASGAIGDISGQLGAIAGLFGSKNQAPVPSYSPSAVADISKNATWAPPNYSLSGG